MSFQNLTKSKMVSRKSFDLVSCMCKWLSCSIFIASFCQPKSCSFLAQNFRAISRLESKRLIGDCQNHRSRIKNVLKSLTYQVFMIVTKMAFISIQTHRQTISNSLQTLHKADQTLCKLFSNALQTSFKLLRNLFKCYANSFQTLSNAFQTLLKAFQTFSKPFANALQTPFGPNCDVW